MKNALIVLFVLILFSVLGSSHANEYKFESGVLYSYDDRSFLDTHTWGAQLKYYWNPITYSNQYPNAEVTFVNRLSFSDISYIGSTSEDNILDINTTGIRVSTRYADKESRHVFNAGYQWLMADLGVFDEDFHTHAFKLGYGYYLLDNFLIQAEFEARFQDSDLLSKTDTYIYGINGKYLWELGNEHWLSVSAAYAYYDIDNEFGLSQSVHAVKANINYYFTVKTSFQIEGGAMFRERERSPFEIGGGGTSDQEFVSVELQHYFLDQFNVRIAARNNFFDWYDEQVYSFAAYYRF